MLSTLLKIGQWQSQGKSEWARFLDVPKVKTSDKNGNEIKNYILPIVFDLDAGEVIIDLVNLEVYDEKKLAGLLPIKVQGGNNKAIYATVPIKKIIQIYKAFFGRENEESTVGELFEAIRNLNPTLLSDEFSALLNDIFSLKEKFIEKLSVPDENTGIKEITPKALKEALKLTRNESIEVVTIRIKSQKHFKSNDTVSFIEVDGYKKFLVEKFLGNVNEEKMKLSTDEKLCYVSGVLDTDVDSLSLAARYSLNKMFVEETKNCATSFNDKLYAHNYQVSKQNQEYLDFASDYLLNRGGHKVKIANIDHVIIPQFLQGDDLSLEMALSKIKTQSDLLFNVKKLEGYTMQIEDETENVFWINFIAFESDGNYFKSTEIIKDVSKFHFQKILKAFIDVDWDFRKNRNIDWKKFMVSNRQEGMFFNFNTIYQLIPLRKDKEKKNRALAFMKSILENRRVESSLLYKYFCELILCHYYERYQSYTNAKESNLGNFSRNVRSSTYKFLALFEVLKKLNLIDMNKETHVSPAESGNKYDVAIQGFFEKMQLSGPQQAMFYLGRMLNAVEFIQRDKKKTVIGKVNFNGMDRDDIQRLRLSLIEEAKQYSKVGKVIFTDSKFGNLFDYNQWAMNPQEAVFFLMTGYSFGISAKDASELEKPESEEIED